MNDDTFINDYGAETGSLEKTKLTLYFASADGQSLVKQEKDVYYNKNVARERLIMDYLLKGPDSDDAKVRFSIRDKDLKCNGDRRCLLCQSGFGIF